jgi:DNA polymerase I
MDVFNSLSSDKTTLLIDGDLYLYQACAACEEEVHWGDDIWSLYCDIKGAKAMFDSRISEFKHKLDTNEFIICFTTGDNFRKTVLPEYKSNRKKTRKPVGYKALVEWVQDNYPCYSQDTLEADDIMGIIQSAKTHPTAIVSDDKDLKTIPGKLYRPMADELLHIKDLEADYNFLTQCLTGDSTDGYGGCPGIGPKRAEKILGNHPSWELVAQAYISAGLTREDAIAQSRCARILRYCDWDSETNSIRLWEPER